MAPAGARAGVAHVDVSTGEFRVTEMDAADQGSGAYVDADIVDRVPMARFASPEDVAQAIAFLADGSHSGFINGVSLPVDGGWIADASWESLRVSTRRREPG